MSSDSYGYVHKPNYRQSYRFLRSDFVMDVEMNSYGHRFPEYDPDALVDPDVTRVMFIGDSQTFGHGVNIEEHFSARVEALLSEQPDDYMVINSGVLGWGTFQSTSYAKDNLDRFNPSIIVYTFVGNDPRDDESFLRGAKDLDRGVFYFPGKVFLRHYSQLYRFVYSKLAVIVHNVVMKREVAEASDAGESIRLDRQSGNAISERQWSRTLRAVTDFHAKYLARNPDGILLVQPSAPWNDDIRDHLRSIANGRNLIFVDLYPEAGSIPESERSLSYDDHWSRRMQEISAQKLFEAIRNLEPANDQHSYLHAVK